MKTGSDNFRSSAVVGIIKRVKSTGIKVIVHEPLLTHSEFYNSPVVNDLANFKKASSLIIANRLNENLIDVRHKTYTRDITNSDD